MHPSKLRGCPGEVKQDAVRSRRSIGKIEGNPRSFRGESGALGGVPEWLNGPVLKTGGPVRAP